MKESKRLKRSFALALFALICAIVVAVTTTMAWYIYTVNSHTTKLHMAAGTNVSLQISNSPDGSFSSSVALKKFLGVLNPVSTNRIQGGFQKVRGFIGGSTGLLANLFSKSIESDQDYYKTSLFFRTTGEDLKVFLSDIGFQDSDDNNPISASIRVGFVVPSTGDEYIFAITDKKNPQRQYNTWNGREGHVLDSSRTDGSTTKFTPLDKNNYCEYDSVTGVVTPTADSIEICTVMGEADGYGSPVQVDVYIWLEGCDEDCIDNIASSSLTDIALSFVGYYGA